MRHRIATLGALLLITPLLAQEGRPNPPQTTERWRGRVLFLVDATSSMRIGDRWQEARALVEELQGELHRTAKFDVVLFHTTNEELYEACKSATPDRLERSRAWLDKASPKATTASPIAHAVKEALRRKPDRIVLISDGVVAPGLKRSNYAKLEKLVRKAARKVNIDTYAVQSGVYAPSPTLEDLAGGSQFLQALATWSGGSFSVISASSATVARFPAAEERRPAVNLLKFTDDRPLPTQVPMGQMFRVSIDDPTLAQLGWVEVPEYGSPVSLVITVIDPESRIEVDRSPVIGLTRQGDRLVAARALELLSASRPLPKGARRALPLRARPGDLVIATYTRGEQRAQAQAWIQDQPEVVLVGGSRAPCSCCGSTSARPRPRPVTPTPGAKPGRPLPPGVGGSTITSGGVPGARPLPPGTTGSTITPSGPGYRPTGTIGGATSGRLPPGTRGSTIGGPQAGGQRPVTGSRPQPARPVTGSRPQPARPRTGSRPQPARPVTGSGCSCGCH